VCDCGANVGDVTAQLAASGAHVHAFDPDPYCIDTLKKRFADAPNVTIHEAALGTREGTIQLMRAVNFDENPKGASVKSIVLEGGRMIDQDLEHAIDVRLLDFPAFLRDLIAEHGEFAFVKMDVEGAELDLLEAMEAAGLFDKIRLTVAETHENKFKELRPRFRALRERLSEAYPITRVNLDWI
jgi:FkbM family methyltransferase